MAIRDQILQIAEGWPAYHQKGRVDKNDRVNMLVTHLVPDTLRPHVAMHESIAVEGSTGAGNITAAPWTAQRFGWEAWTRTRIARSRVWSPTNWTTSQQEEQKRTAARSRGSGQPRFTSLI